MRMGALAIEVERGQGLSSTGQKDRICPLPAHGLGSSRELFDSDEPL